jgi:hypothetical protein
MSDSRMMIVSFYGSRLCCCPLVGLAHHSLMVSWGHYLSLCWWLRRLM